MKFFKLPSAQTILIIIAAAVAILTWVIPAGKFDTLFYDKEDLSFVLNAKGESIKLNANQTTLDSLNIKIPFSKFSNGDIWKPIAVPGTYMQVEGTPQGFAEFLKSPVKGIIAAADIIFLILIIGGLIGIMNLTGAFNAGISWLAHALNGREFILIILVTTLVALGGTTFGLAEETIAFFPILIPVFIAAKYDALVGLACIYLGSSIGTMCSTTNPFSTIIASDAAGINWTTGLNGRVFMLVVCLVITIIYILRYAKRVKENPEASLIYDQKEEIENLFGDLFSQDSIKLTIRLRLILGVFSLCFVVMIYGVSQLDWWFAEMTTIFLVGAVLVAFIGKIKETDFLKAFIDGASELLGVAFIVGIARGITILMEDGMISDTLLYYASNVTDGMDKGFFVNTMLYVYSGLSFFIPSSSGMAVLTMPIMSPLADTVGLGRETIVNCYQYGMGLFSLINPTGLILASLAIVNIGYNKWLKFVLPLMIIIALFIMIVLTALAYY